MRIRPRRPRWLDYLLIVMILGVLAAAIILIV